MKIIVKKEDIEKFDNSDIGKVKNKYFKRIRMNGILSSLIAIGWIIYNIYSNANWKEYLVPSTLYIFGIYFIINGGILKKKEVNLFINKNKKTSK